MRRPSRRTSRTSATAASLLVLLVALSSCGAQATGDDEKGAGGPLTVFAAASLTDAFTELDRKFESRTGATVRINFAGSSTLATQILQGAAADVYASANQEQMGRVRKDGLLSADPEIFARNKEVIVVPDKNPANIQSMRDLAKPGVRLVLAAEGVPAAEYAEQILNDAESRYGPKFKDKVLDNLVSREADVRAAVNRVVVGDADAAFGYSSDVTPDIRDQVKVIEIPPKFNVVAKYPIATLKQAKDKELARQWISFVRSDAGQRVLKKWGFQRVSR